ncbi:MAG TPA: response regulator [Chitinophagales bacterium]|nr:response regulator [Chitinophagales bacterium]
MTQPLDRIKAARGAPPVVLIAEDDLDDRLFVEEALHETAPGAKAVFVADGNEMLGYMHDCVDNGSPLPRLIILDINMPRKNGREALAELRADKAFDNVPVIVFSTVRNSEAGDNLRELGADQFISKPSRYNEYRGIFIDVSQRWLAEAS